MKQEYNVAIIGVTGSAGMSTLRILEERNFPIKSLVPIASDRSVGRIVSFKDRNLPVQAFSSVDFSKIDFAFLCAGSKFSSQYGEAIAKAGCVVIDKSPYFRLFPNVPLVVPEINGNLLRNGNKSGIISSPNCITIPLSMTLAALRQVSPLRRVVVSTYQSVSGAGRKAIDGLYNQTKSVISNMGNSDDIFPKPIAFNVLPLVGHILDNGQTDEEEKIIQESKKILQEDLEIAVQCVRVPVFIGHSMSVLCDLDLLPNDMNIIREAFEAIEGILVVDNQEEETIVTPLDIQGDDSVYVNRIRVNPQWDNSLQYWVVADNLRKGAALNSVQIAELLLEIDPTLSKFSVNCKQ